MSAAPGTRPPAEPAEPAGGGAGGRALADRLSGALEAWRSEPLHRHALAGALLVLVLVLRWWSLVTFPVPLNDEMPYFSAFERVVAGGSPYSGRGYIYPAVPAVVGAWLLEALGPALTLALLRLANLSGLAMSVWCALAWLPWRWPHRLGAAALFLCVAPAVGYGVLLGNLSLLIGGTLVVALTIWRRAPWAAALLLGLGLAVKPVAPVALLVLALHRPVSRGRARWIAAGAGAALAAVLVVSFPYLDEMLGLDIHGRLGRTLSLHRFAYLLGLPDSTLWLTAALAAGAVALARRRPLGEGQVLLLAVTAALAASPLVWSHTLVIALPLQAIALSVAVLRFQAAGAGDAPRRRLYELVFVLLAVAAIQWAEGASGIDDRGLLLQWLGSMPPALAPPLLTGYVFYTTEPF